MSEVRLGPYLNDPDFTLWLGDALTVTRELPSQSVNCCITSPPYWKLRDYAADEQLGNEATPDEYVTRLIEVFAEVARVLRDDGTLWLNLGDSYVGTSGGGQGKGGARADRTHTARIGVKSAPGLKAKNLAGIPWRVAFALQAEGWYLRSDIIWHKPNPMPSSATDRPTLAHEYLFLFTRSSTYYYDADAIREEAKWERWGDQTTGSGSMGWIGPGKKRELVKRRTVREGVDTNGGGQGAGAITLTEGQGKNKRSVWTIPTESNPDPHYATFPQALVEPCILAGTSEKGYCAECGAPWVRETERVDKGYDGSRYGENAQHANEGVASGGTARSTLGSSGGTLTGRRETVAWKPTCDHNARIVNGTIFDPFIGSGTTALVARRLGRKCVGVEISRASCEIAARRTQQLSVLG